MLPALIVRPDAELDMLEAAAWYDGERPGLGDEFLDSIAETFARVEEGPARFISIGKDIRRAGVRRFPFGVFFAIEPSCVVVLAVMHLHRHPHAWESRR